MESCQALTCRWWLHYRHFHCSMCFISSEEFHSCRCFFICGFIWVCIILPKKIWLFLSYDSFKYQLCLSCQVYEVYVPVQLSGRAFVLAAQKVVGSIPREHIHTTLPKNCTHPKWAKGLAKSLWTPDIQHTTAVNCYRLVDATELRAPEWPDTETVSFPKQSSHEHLILNMEYITLLYIIYSPHTLIFHFKFAHTRPHT